MSISIIAPGINCKVDKSKVNIACNIVASIIEEIFYESSKDVLSIYNEKDVIAEVYVKQENNINVVCVNGKLYCLPDSEDVIFNLIGKQINA